MRRFFVLLFVAACGETLPLGTEDGRPDGGIDGGADASDPAMIADGGSVVDATDEAATTTRAIPCGSEKCASSDVCCFGAMTAACASPMGACNGAKLGCLGLRDCAPGQQCCITPGAPPTSTCKPTCAIDDSVLCWLKENDSAMVGCGGPTSCTGALMDDKFGLPNAPYGTCELK